MTETNHEMSIKSEIELLEKQLQEKKQALEKGPAGKKEAEISKENISETESSNVQMTAQTQVTPAFTNDDDKSTEISTDISKIKDLDVSRQVKILTTLAFEKGIQYSIKVARGLNSPYLLDELHDKLVGELHDELVKKGKLKEI